MHKKSLVKIIAVLMAVSICIASLSVGGLSAYSEVSTNPNKNSANLEQEKEEAENALQNQKDELEKNLQESEKKLAELSVKSKNTEEYINALDEKIGYLNEQLTLIDNDVVAYQEDIDVLQGDIDKNQIEADTLQLAVDESQKILDGLNAKFKHKYDAYCIRVRAIYISGNFNLLSALLTCKDISSFLTRYEMIKSVSKSDAELLADIEEQTEVIMKQENELNEKKAALEVVLGKLLSQKNQLQSKQNALTKTQEVQAKKKAILASDRAESDRLLAELTSKNGMYTEFRNEDKELVDALEKEIADLISGIKNPDEVTLATTSDRTDVTGPAYSYSDVYNNSDAVLNMTYPVPGNYVVSCHFGKYSSGKPHTGIDFPCAKGSKVVAAQSGIVIKAQRLNYSYGYYVMIYHGTDARGRSVVTLYAHNSNILVSVGQTVSKGQQIAKSGSTGNSTGPHCHFEIRLDNKAVNPKNYLSK